MGQAKRRKQLGLMPEPTLKPRKKARMKNDFMDYGMGMGELSMLLSPLMRRGRSGELFAIRSEMARLNREEEGA